jgi:hypothetical protein
LTLDGVSTGAIVSLTGALDCACDGTALAIRHDSNRMRCIIFPQVPQDAGYYMTSPACGG